MSLKNFFIFGLVGLFLDLDHMIPVLDKGIPLTQAWHYMTLSGVRSFHIFGLWASLMVFIYCWANETEQDGAQYG